MDFFYRPRLFALLALCATTGFLTARPVDAASSCDATSLTASGSCRWDYLIQSQIGTGESIKMGDYFPSLANHPTTFLRKIYYRQNGKALYLMQVIDPLPFQDQAQGYMTEPNGILQSGAQYYNLMDYLPLSDSTFAYLDTWHMRNSSDGSVASITDSFAANAAQPVEVNGVQSYDTNGTPKYSEAFVNGSVCEWPSAGCEGSTHFYWGSQQNDKLVFGGGNEWVGPNWTPTIDNMTSPDQYPVYMPEWIMPDITGSAYTSPFYYMSSMTLSSSQIWGESHFAVTWVLERYPTYTVPVTGKTYTDVIKVLFMHGAMLDGKPYLPGPAQANLAKDCPPPADLAGFTWPSTYSSYIQVQWLAKGVGFIQLEDVWDYLSGSEQVLGPGKVACHMGSYTDGAGPWSGYLGYADLEDRNSHAIIYPNYTGQ